MRVSRRIIGGFVALAALALAYPALAQPKLVVYSANESTLNDLVFGAFEKETGIQVQPVATGSGVLMRRIASEKDNPLGDIVWASAVRCSSRTSLTSRPIARSTATPSRRSTAIPMISGSATICIC